MVTSSSCSPRVASRVRSAPATAASTTSLTVPPCACPSVADSGQVDGDDVEPPPRPDRPVERCGRPPARRPGAPQFCDPLADPAQAARLARRAWSGPRHPVQAAPPGIGGEFPRPRCRCREPVRPRPCRLGGLVDQRAKHRETGDAVRQHVVHDDEQPGAAVGQPGDERGRPQRAGPGQRLAELSRGQIEQRPLVARRRAARLPDVLIDIECRIIGPVRSPASRRRPVKPLPQPRYCTDPLAEHPPRLGDTEPRRGAEHQDGPDVPGSSPVSRSELHQVRGASPVKRGGHRQFTAA